jgi:hypothetical protein
LRATFGILISAVGRLFGTTSPRFEMATEDALDN